jgi:hypothetical protein
VVFGDYRAPFVSYNQAALYVYTNDVGYITVKASRRSNVNPLKTRSQITLAEKKQDH